MPTATAMLRLDPTIEPTAQPRRYVVEATVTGEDDQTVTTTHQVLALPAFVLGVKLPRFLEKAVSIDPEIIAVGPDGKLIEGQEITVRLLRRQWHSALQATDFSQGTAKYVTDVVDDKIAETQDHQRCRAQGALLRRSIAPASMSSSSRRKTAPAARRSSPSISSPMATNRSPGRASPRRNSPSRPTRRAMRRARSPISCCKAPTRRARALAVIEHADGKNDYRWIPVANGAGNLKLDDPPQGHAEAAGASRC